MATTTTTETSVVIPLEEQLAIVNSVVDCFSDGYVPQGDDAKKAPVGLEKQYAELHALLQRGLLGDGTGGVDQDRSNSGAEEGVGASQKRRNNVSAIIMGPRGHGKTMMLEQCLAALEVEGRLRRQRNSRKREGADTFETCGIVKKPRTSPPVGVVGSKVPQGNQSHTGQDPQSNMDEFVSGGKTNDATHDAPSDLDERDEDVVPSFRVVRLHGSLLQGDLGTAVHEVVTQIADIAAPTAGREHSRNGWLRLRQTSFTSNLALLDEVLRMARIDSIPILMVLEDLDSFLVSSSPGEGGWGTGGLSTAERGKNNKQLLLYHLLDRVADHSSLLSFVGVTSSLSTVGMLEKRVKSRAEGTSHIIYVGHPKTYDILVQILLAKFDTEVAQSAPSTSYRQSLKHQLEKILLFPQSVVNTGEGHKETSQAEKIRAIFQWNYRLGKNVRWFCRVMSGALSLLAQDLDDLLHSSEDHFPTLELQPTYLWEGLILMGGTSGFEGPFSAHKNPVVPDSRAEKIFETIPSQSSRRTIPPPLAYGPFREDGSRHGGIGFDNPRLSALLDLVGPEVIVLLAARRILCRDEGRQIAAGGEHRGQEQLRDKPPSAVKTNAIKKPAPLTLDRIVAEYETSFLTKSWTTAGADRYEESILARALLQVMEVGLVRPAANSPSSVTSSCVPYQFQWDPSHHTIDRASLGRLPLVVNVDLDRELWPCLLRKLLDCSTAVREWGMKIV